jgi:hypothetical protein
MSSQFCPFIIFDILSYMSYPSFYCFSDSNLQTFPPSDNRGKVAGSFQPPRDADGMQPSTVGGYLMVQVLVWV